jgi:hypothetical protein
MHPTAYHEMATARIADLHHDAARERAAKLAVRARRAQPHHRTRPAPGHAITSLARRAITLARGRSPASTR